MVSVWAVVLLGCLRLLLSLPFSGQCCEVPFIASITWFFNHQRPAFEQQCRNGRTKGCAPKLSCPPKYVVGKEERHVIHRRDTREYQPPLPRLQPHHPNSPSSSTPKLSAHRYYRTPPSATTAPKRPCPHPLCVTQQQAAAVATPPSSHAQHSHARSQQARAYTPPELHHHH